MSAFCQASALPHFSNSSSLTSPLPVPESSLPSSKSSSLQLLEATPTEKLQTWILNYKEWGGAFSLPSYVAREQYLASQTLTSNGGITHWVLLDPEPAPEPSRQQAEDRNILASCDTIRKRALVARLSDTGAPELQEVVSHGLFSVFCRKEYRGRGYARRMMHELAMKLETWGQKEGKVTQFTVVYSDIGKQFYANYGWKAFQSSHISLPPVRGSRENFVDSIKQPLPSYTSLYASNLEELCRQDEKLLKGRLMDFSSSGPRIRVALIPDIETIQWHHAGEEYSANNLFGRDPNVKGAIADIQGKIAWCTWTRAFDTDKTENVLHVLRFVIENSHDLKQATIPNGDDIKGQVSLAVKAVLHAAQVEAAEWAMHHVEIWNPTSPILLAAKELSPALEISHREEEGIPSLMWYGPPAERDNVEWIDNEKYGNWF